MGLYDVTIRRIVLPDRAQDAAGQTHFIDPGEKLKSAPPSPPHPWTRETSPSLRYRWGKEENGLIPIERWREKYGGGRG